jgi:hypothetical protein
MATIKIVTDPEKKLCRCGTWLDHWNKFSGLKVRICGIKECPGFDLMGVKVQKADSEDDKIYIIPVCSAHADSKEILETYDSITLVSSDIKTTCGTATSIYLKEGER